MSINRLRERVPSANVITIAKLSCHLLDFHKVSIDGSGKCDAYETGNPDDFLYGVVFEIDPSEKRKLDRAEGLGYGYEEKEVTVIDNNGKCILTTTYYATNIYKTLKPYHWYKNFVVHGAKENNLPKDYIEMLTLIESIDDPDKVREKRNENILIMIT